MKKAGILILVFIITAAAGLAIYHYLGIPKEEGIARLRPAKIDLFSDLSSCASSYTIREQTQPVGLLDVPADIADSDLVFYFVLPVGQEDVFAIVHKPHSGGAVAWVDLDMNKHLSDEKAFTGRLKKHTEDGRTWHFYDFGKVVLNSETTDAAFHLVAHDEIYYISIHPICCVKGKIKLGGYVYRVAVIDGDYDGKFNTRYEPSTDSRNYGYYKSDTIVVDTSHGLFSWKTYDPGKIVPMGKYHKFNRNRYHHALPNGKEGFYSVALSADGKTLRMQPAQPEMGTLKIGKDKRLSIELLSDTAIQEVNFRDTIEIPAGRYQIHYGQLSYMPENEPGFETMADFREDIRKGQFEIKPGQTVTLNPGPPFTVKTYVNGGSDNRININAGLLGNEGEEYGLRISRDMTRPVLKILDENGDELHSGAMEYG